MTTDTPAQSRTAPLWPCLVPAGVFAVAAWGMILAGHMRGRGAHDHINYHLPAVERFAREWPRLDYSDYLSATTPGYHTVLAGVARYVSDSAVALQLVGSLFSVGLLAAIGLACRGAGRGACALALPAAASMYVFFSGVWLLPDNAGWLGVLAVVLLALRGRFDAWTVVGGGAVLCALVFVRQSHLWAAAALWACAWLGAGRPGDDAPFGVRDDARALTDGPARRAGRTALMVAATAPAALIVAYFCRLWGGLVPPTFQERHVGGNPAAPAFILSLLGVFGVFYAGYLAPSLLELVRRHRWLLGFALGAGVACALVPETTYSTEAGRYSGLWNVVERAPVVGGRTSVVLVALAPLGAAVVAAWFVALPRRERWVMLATVGAFTASQVVSYKLWQRYTEPLVLILLPVLACRVRAVAVGGGGLAAVAWRLRAAGPGALGVALAVATAVVLVRAAPVGLIVGPGQGTAATPDSSRGNGDEPARSSP